MQTVKLPRLHVHRHTCSDLLNSKVFSSLSKGEAYTGLHSPAARENIFTNCTGRTIRAVHLHHFSWMLKKKSKKIKFWTLYTANIIIISFKLLCNLLVLLSFKSVAVNCYHDTLANTWCGSFWLNKTILHKCRARHNCRYLGTSVMKIKGNKSEALRDYPATDHPHLTVAISSQQSTIGHGSQNQLAYSDLHRPHLKCCQLHAAGVVLGMQLLQFPWERWGWMQWWCSRPVPADWAAR